ncbi:MAG: hypothetical protein CL868_16755 [Cytophagaceae bacterium]|nr:hypothetical protein [Cytophagaceae bacterium]
MKINNITYIITICLMFMLAGCDDLIEIDAPNDQLVSQKVFQDTSSINSAVLGMYTKVANPERTQGGLGTTTTLFNGLLGDEIRPFNAFLYTEFATNSLLSNSNFVESYWNYNYKNIYTVNSVIEGLETSNQSKTYIDPLIGEAKFLRALSYLYLVNGFGPVPLVTQTDLTVTASLPREHVDVIYTQIIQDLEDAIEVLPANFEKYGGQRTRATSWAASALLARVFLYIEDWESAFNNANAVIEDTNLFSLEPDLEKVFLANSQEGILQFVPAFSSSIWMSSTFYPSFSANYVLRDGLLSSFEAGDKRRDAWVIDYETQGEIFPHSAKYKRTYSNPSAVEYNQVLRLSELYLIRAEASMHLGMFQDAVSDINVVRKRAGLDALAAPDNQHDLMILIENERNTELFVEWGHRWFDLKRWPGLNDPSISRAEEILPDLKGEQWQSTDQLLPIPQSNIINNPNLVQNPGYN